MAPIKPSKRIFALLLGAASLASAEPELASLYRQKLPAGAVVVDVSEAEVGGAGYVLVKYVGKDGNIAGKNFRKGGQELSSPFIASKPSLLSPQLEKRIAAAGGTSAPIKVWVALRLDEEETEEDALVGRDRVDKSGNVMSWIGKARVSEVEVQSELDKRTDRAMERMKKRLRAKEAAVRRFSQRFRSHTKALDLEKESADLSGAVTLILTPAEIAHLVKNNQGEIEGIEIHSEGSNESLETALVSTEVNPVAWNSTPRGNQYGIYMTEDACATSTNELQPYFRAGGTHDHHPLLMAQVMRAVAPEAMIRCRNGGGGLPNRYDIGGCYPNSTYCYFTKTYTANMSWGYPDAGGAYQTTDRDWDDFIYNQGWGLVKSAGNLGTGTGNITSPGLALNAITVGNYDDATDAMRTTSSYKSVNTTKPEVSAPGVNHAWTGSGGVTSGTSISAAHVSGMVSDLMSLYPNLKLRPHYAKALIMAGATRPISGGLDKVGYGGVKMGASVFGSDGMYWEGSNGMWTTWAQQDGHPDDYVQHQVWMDAHVKFRIVFAYLTRGAWNYANRNQIAPLGIDLDLTLTDVNGNFLRSSASIHNGFEVIDYVAPVSGLHIIKISRHVNRDTANKLNMGFWMTATP